MLQQRRGWMNAEIPKLKEENGEGIEYNGWKGSRLSLHLLLCLLACVHKTYSLLLISFTAFCFWNFEGGLHTCPYLYTYLCLCVIYSMQANQITLHFGASFPGLFHGPPSARPICSVWVHACVCLGAECCSYACSTNPTKSWMKDGDVKIVWLQALDHIT